MLKNAKSMQVGQETESMIYACVCGAYLIHDILDVNWLQYLGLNDSMQVSVHELKHQVDVLIIAGSDDIQQLYHVLVRGKLLY